MRFPSFAVLAAITAVPAQAQQAGGEVAETADTIIVSGSASLTTDYRFRGVSQSDGELAVQAGITATHASGVYVGAWGSNLAGWGTFGGANMELDLYAGVKLPLGTGTLDTGMVWYIYPGGADETDFAELYARLSGSVGPLSLSAGAAYAPKQAALGNVFFTGAAATAGQPDAPGDKGDNLYLLGDAAYALPDMPIRLKAHLGYSDGNPGLGPNATSIAPTGTYFDWMLGVDITPLEGLTLSLAYVDTDISEAESAYLHPKFSRGQDGAGAISGPTVVASVTALF